MHNDFAIIGFFLSMFFLLLTTSMDVHATAKGIAAGEAVEGNRLIVWMFGTKPTLLQDWIGALICDLPFVALATVGLVLGSYPMFIPGCFASVVYGARRLKAVAAWSKLHRTVLILAVILGASALASAGASACYTLIRISEREVAITCANGDPSASKTPAGMLVVTCPQ